MHKMIIVVILSTVISAAPADAGGLSQSKKLEGVNAALLTAPLSSQRAEC